MTVFALWIHVLAAVVWVGGMLFMGIVVAPASRAVEEPSVRTALMSAVGQRFKVVGWICIALLILTGIFNLMSRLATASLSFHRALGVKLLLVLAMIALSAVHDFVLGPRLVAQEKGGASAEAVAPLRRRVISLARLNALLGIIVVWLGLLLSRS